MFKIDVTKEIGGESVSIPTLTLESEKAAKEKLDELVAALKDELDQPYMRDVGGRAEVFFCRVRHMFDEGVELDHITLKRPLHSPNVMIIDRNPL